MKTKLELTEELNKEKYYYKFFFEKKPKELEKKIIKFYFEDDINFEKYGPRLEDIFLNTTPILLIFDENHNISATASLSEYLLFDLKFYTIHAYIRKKDRMKILLKNKILFDYLWPLSYHESYEHLQFTGNKNNIVGLHLSISNERLYTKYLKKKTFVDDGYAKATYVGDRSYILYYPDTFINKDIFYDSR